MRNAKLRTILFPLVMIVVNPASSLFALSNGSVRRLAIGLNQTPPNISYKIYSNARYRYSIAYPAGVLVPRGESENGDGQRFASRDGKALLTVWGAQRMDKSLREEYKDAMSNRNVTYKVIRADWFVVSGVENGKIFYQKTLIRGRVFKTFILEYDEAVRSEFDEITKRVSRSFRG